MIFFWRAGFALFILEALVFFAVVGKIGLFNTLCLWAISALVGGYLVRTQGLSTITKIMAGGRIEAAQLYDSLCLLLAGFLFIFPGFVSDILGFLLIIPMVRHSFREQSLKIFRFSQTTPTPSPYDDGVIEGKYEVVDDPAPRITNPPQQS